VKTKAPARAGTKYQGVRTEQSQKPQLTPSPDDAAGSTQKAYTPPGRAQVAFLWLCALADLKFWYGHAECPQLGHPDHHFLNRFSRFFSSRSPGFDLTLRSAAKHYSPIFLNER
jgi:hypothetical protein